MTTGIIRGTSAQNGGTVTNTGTFTLACQQNIYRIGGYLVNADASAALLYFLGPAPTLQQAHTLLAGDTLTFGDTTGVMFSDAVWIATTATACAWGSLDISAGSP